MASNQKRFHGHLNRLLFFSIGSLYFAVLCVCVAYKKWMVVPVNPRTHANFSRTSFILRPLFYCYLINEMRLFYYCLKTIILFHRTLLNLKQNKSMITVEKIAGFCVHVSSKVCTFRFCCANPQQTNTQNAGHSLCFRATIERLSSPCIWRQIAPNFVA